MAGLSSRNTLLWTRIGLWLLAVLAGGALVATLILGKNDNNAATQVNIGGPFTLTDHTGQKVSDTDFRGKILLVYFGFTYCPDICPNSLQLVGAALDELPPSIRAQVQPIFITVDPERDTPEILGPYVSHFAPEMIGLTGSAEEIKEVADRYRVAFGKVKQPDSAMPYTVDHASLIFLMDRDGKYLTHAVSKPGVSGNLTKASLSTLIRQVVE